MTLMNMLKDDPGSLWGSVSTSIPTDTDQRKIWEQENCLSKAVTAKDFFIANAIYKIAVMMIMLVLMMMMVPDLYWRSALGGDRHQCNSDPLFARQQPDSFFPPPRQSVFIHSSSCRYNVGSTDRICQSKLWRSSVFANNWHWLEWN